MTNRSKNIFILATCLLTLLTVSVSHGSAQVPNTTPVTPRYKGTVGGALLGFEAGLVIPAVAGLHETWAMVTFPVLGGVGGGLAGYYLLEKGVTSPAPAIIALAAGTMLFIPALIITLNSMAYDPADDVKPESENAIIVGSNGQKSKVKANTRVAAQRRTGGAIALGLVNKTGESWRLGLPMVSPEAVYSQDEIIKLHLQQQTELRVSLLSGSF